MESKGNKRLEAIIGIMALALLLGLPIVHGLGWEEGRDLAASETKAGPLSGNLAAKPETPVKGVRYVSRVGSMLQGSSPDLRGN